MKNFLRVGEALIFGSWMLGQALAYAPNVSAAVISASRIMQILNRKPTVADSEKVVLNYAKVSLFKSGKEI